MRRSFSTYSTLNQQAEGEKASKSAVQLKFWVFRLYDNNPKKVCVQGYCNVNSSNPKLGKVLQCWRSSPIEDCISEKRLITNTGTEYCLVGSMDIDQAIVYNYSEEIITAFKNGFPADWNNLLRKEHKRLHSNAIKRDYKNFTSAVLTDLANLCPSDTTKSSIRPKEEILHKFKFPTPAVKARPTSPQPTPMNVVCKVNNKRQIISASLNDEVRVSKRSGRLIKQPLQSWLGERIVYDVDGNAIEGHSITTKELDNPNVSDRLAALCDGLGVGRVEPSKQTQRRSIQPLLAREVDNKKRFSKEGGAKRKKKTLVDYSDSDSDSFLDFVDRIQLSPESERNYNGDKKMMKIETYVPSKNQLSPEPRKYSGNKSSFEIDTPIPLKHQLKNRRVIFSPSPQPSEEGNDIKYEKENEPKPKKKKKTGYKKKLFRKGNIGKKSKVRTKPWSQEEIKRLQIAIKASSKPKVDWKVINRCVSGGQRSVKECEEQAEKLGFKRKGYNYPNSMKIAKQETTSKVLKNQQKVLVKKKKCQNISGSTSNFDSESDYSYSYLDRLDKILHSPTAQKTSIKKITKKRTNESIDEDLHLDYIVEQPDSTVGSSDERQKRSPIRKLTIQKPLVVPKNKRWTADETQRLKNALKLAVNPQTEQDWEVIAKAIANQNNHRSGQACREQAQKIRWKPPTVQPTSKPMYDSPDEPCCSKSSSDKRRNKRSMAEPDFFGGRNQDITCLQLDPNDSLLQLLNNSEADPKNLRMPFMRPVLNETVATRRRSSFGQDYSF